MTTVYLEYSPSLVIVRIPIICDQGDMADYREDIGPGESWYGWTFAELQALGSGEHDLADKPGPVTSSI